MRYRLRTLLILLAVGPLLLWIGWTKYEAWRAEQAGRDGQRAAIRLWLVLDETSIAFDTRGPKAQLISN
jgi:hypothetical protein